MKRITIKIAIAGISALFITAVLLKPQHLKVSGTDKKPAAVQYAYTKGFPGSPLGLCGEVNKDL